MRENMEVKNDKPPSCQTNLYRLTRRLSASFVAIGYLLRQWTNDSGDNDICSIRGANHCRRLSFLDDI